MSNTQQVIPTVTVNSGPPRNDVFENGYRPALDVTDPETLQKGADYDNLADLMLRCAVQHAEEEEVFWPGKRLRRILTRARVLESLKAYDLDRMVDEVLHKYLKVFAILALIEEEDQIGVFLGMKVCDQDLPLVKCRTTPWKQFMARKEAPEEALKPLCPKTTNSRESFLLKQHRVLVPYLDFGTDRRATHVDFPAQTIFPWRSRRLKENGGFASVFQVDIDPDCHGFHDALKSINTGTSFAVKELVNQKRDSDVKAMKGFQNEVDMLRRFSGYPHLVTLLMTWTFKDQRHFLFPCASCDLDHYWNCHSKWHFVDLIKHTMKPDHIVWISKQVRGIADALDILHNPRHLLGIQKYGRHGDIKPENILWYPSPLDAKGILVIADFGLAAFNSKNSRSNIPNQGIPQTPGYRPPECDLEGGKISRAFDVWTLGCLLLELTCWVLGGPTLREDFGNDRMSPYITGSQSDIFFDVKTKIDGGGHVIQVKEKVTQMIAQLHGKQTCTEYFHDLLDLIEDEMVIVRSEPKDRVRSHGLLQKIGKMHSKVMDPSSPGYGQAPHPRPREPKPCLAYDAILNDTALGLVHKHGEGKLSAHKGPTLRSATVHR